MGIRIDGNNDLINAADGSLTVEGLSIDVTGIVTASGGYKVGSAYTVFSNGNVATAGIVTAAAFIGDGSGLTGAGPTLTGSTNNTIVTVTGANAIQGESNLTFDGSALSYSSGGSERFNLAHTSGGVVSLKNPSNAALLIGTNDTERIRIASDGKIGINIVGSDNTSPVRNLDIADASGAILRLISTDDSLGASERLGAIEFFTDDDDGGHVGAAITAIADPSDSFGRRTALLFGTQSTEAANCVERLRITAAGYVGINETSPSVELVVAPTDANESQIQILAGGNGKESNLLFGAPDDADVGSIKYDHNGDHMKFTVGTSEIFRANSHGICLGGTGSANGLSDYEEGSFTPVLLEDGSTTYSQQNGKYTKIGNRVYFNVYIKINSHDGSSGTATGITLPFQNDFGTGVVTATVVGNDHWDTNLSESNMTGWMGNGTTTMRFYKNSGLNLQAITVDDIGDSGEIAIAGHYPTNS